MVFHRVEPGVIFKLGGDDDNLTNIAFSDGLKQFNHQLEHEDFLFLEWGMIFDVQHCGW